MSVKVVCGNGGDYEYYQDHYYWTMWIKNNIVADKFDIKPGKEADQAIVYFDDNQLDLIFALKAPQYITYNEIKEYANNISR